MGPDQQRLTPSERADLVAYLDGELDDGESRAIATKLSHSATARREVESLERTWELLDHLPRPKASEEFTARTISEVLRGEAEGRRRGAAVVDSARQVVRVIAAVVLALGAYAAGSALMAWAWPSPTERLSRELPIAEHLDELRDVGSFDFLKELVESPEFSTDRD